MPYDKYESTDLGDISFDERSGVEKATDAAAPFVEKIKENRKIIIGAVIVLILGYLAYDFFIGSYRAYSINIENTEGKSIGAVVKLFDSDKKEITSFQGSKELSLKKGNYTVDVAMNGYIPKAGQAIKVGDSDNSAAIKLEKRIDVEIDLPEEFPEVVLNGERIERQVILTNNGDDEQAVELAYEGFGAGIRPDPQSEITLGPNQTTTANAAITIGNEVKPARINGKIRIKYTLKSEAVVFEVKAFSAALVEITPSNIKRTSMQPGTPVRVEFKIINKNPVPLRNITLSTQISENSKYLNTENALGWISIDPSSIAVVPAKEANKNGEISGSIMILPSAKDLEIPSDISSDAILAGKIDLNSTYMSKSIVLDLSIKKANVDIEVTGIDQKYTAKYKELDSAYSFDDEITLKNTSTVEIKNVNMGKFECKLSTSDNWQKSDYVSAITTKWPSILPKASVKSSLAIRVSSMEPENKTIWCRGSITYDNPFSVPGTDDESILFKEIGSFQIITSKK